MNKEDNITSHQLAKMLLDLPDVPVVINGWGSDEGLGGFVVTEAIHISSEDECFETPPHIVLQYPNENPTIIR